MTSSPGKEMSVDSCARCLAKVVTQKSPYVDTAITCCTAESGVVYKLDAGWFINHTLRSLYIGVFFQRKTKGQQLKGKIVSDFSHFFTLFGPFS